MAIRDLRDMYALSPQACGPQALGIYIRQIPHAHVTTITQSLSIIIFSKQSNHIWTKQNQ